MDIRNRKELKRKAATALSGEPNHKTIVAVYMAASSLLALVLSLVDLWLSNQIENMSGLDNMGTRAVWQTVQEVLPILQMLVLLCWSFGYRKVMMGIRNGKTATPRNLLDAFPDLWRILRLTILQALIFAGLGIACIYAGTLLFLLTPFSSGVMEQAQQLMSQSSILYEELAVSGAFLQSLYDAIVPLSLILVAVCALVMLPICYSLRLAPYWLLDYPRGKARYAIGNSRRMMRRHRWQLFRLDLSFWWFYLLELLAMVLCYADVLLPMVGVTLPFGTLGNSFLFYIAYLLAQFGIAYAFQNQVEMTYVEAYEALKPQPQATNGVVLGNIFQM